MASADAPPECTTSEADAGPQRVIFFKTTPEKLKKKILSTALGENCSFDEECLAILEVNAVKCVENKCTCAEGFYTREYSDCRKKAESIYFICHLRHDK
jgi:hypothetical protein